MHARTNLNNNEQGQSTIESALILCVFITTLIFTLKLALKFILLLSVDDFLESYLLCNAYQPAVFCKSELRQKTARVHLNLESVQLIEDSDKIVAYLQVSNGLFETLQRSREYHKRH